MAGLRPASLAFGGVDIVVNNAGIAGGQPITETTLADWQRNQDVLATCHELGIREVYRMGGVQAVAALAPHRKR